MAIDYNRHNVARLCIATTLGTLLVCACAAPPKEQPTPVTSTDVFERAQLAYLDGRFGDAVTLFEKYLREHPHSARVAEAHYWIGRAYLNTGAYTQAESNFGRATRTARQEPWKSLAQMGLADALFMQKRYKDARPLYESVWKSGPSADIPPDLLLYRIGQCEQRSGRDAQAQEWFDRLRTSYPDSRYVERTPSAVPEPRAHYIQLGIFSTAAAAQKHADTLRARSIECSIAQEGSRHIVRTGEFKTLAEAERRVAELKAVGIDAVAK